MSDAEYDARQRMAAGVRAAIQRIGGSKASVAGRLAVSVQTLSKWIYGASVPNDANLARLARLSGLDQETIRQGGKAAA